MHKEERLIPSLKHRPDLQQKHRKELLQIKQTHITDTESHINNKARKENNHSI